MQSFRLGDAIKKGAGLRPVEGADLDPEFRARLLKIFEKDPKVAGVWLLWMTWPDKPSELVMQLLIDDADEDTVGRILAHVNALGGPPCVGALPAAALAAEAFYRRPNS